MNSVAKDPLERTPEDARPQVPLVVGGEQHLRPIAHGADSYEPSRIDTEFSMRGFAPAPRSGAGAQVGRR